MKTIPKALIKKLEKHRNNIAKERDQLRQLCADVDSLVSAADDGIDALENAIDILSGQS